VQEQNMAEQSGNISILNVASQKQIFN